MNLYRVTLDATNHRTLDGARVTLLRRAISPRDAARGIGTVYHNLDTGEVNTSGGFGKMARSRFYDEWRVIGVRKSRSKTERL